MANVTQGLFGFDPMAQAQQRDDALQERAVQYARLSPVQQGQMALYRAGSQIGGAGASLMGVKDPQLEAQALIQKTAASLDLTDHVAVRAVANQWMQSGNAVLQDKALKLNDVADRAEETANARTKERASIDLAARKASQQASFSKEYATAPDAEGRLAVTRKYAEMPELLKLDEAALARKDKADEAAVARADKSAEAKTAREALYEQQRFLAGESARNRASATSDSKRASQSLKEDAANLKATALQEKVNNTNEKQTDLDVKASRSAATNATHADQMISDSKDAKSLVRFETTGRTGQAAAAINPGGDAGILRNRIATLKANLGFDRLQRMREESPTGGALGQVAVQELEALQASVASLSPMQSETELARSLDKVAKHYSGWKDTIVTDDNARNKRRAGQQSINIPGAVARNPSPTAAPSAWGKAVEH